MYIYVQSCSIIIIQSWNISLAHVVKISIHLSTYSIHQRFYSNILRYNTENSSKEDIGDLLLEIKNFWIGTLCTIQGFKGFSWLETGQKESVITIKNQSTYLLAGFHMKNKFSLENVLLRMTLLEIILSVLLEYILCF